MIPSNSELRKRVRAGIARLDELGPTDWRTRIDLRKLQVDTLHACPITQIYGGSTEEGQYVPGTFSDAMISLNIGTHEAEDFGFDIVDGDKETGPRLDEIWREELS